MPTRNANIKLKIPNKRLFASMRDVESANMATVWLLGKEEVLLSFTRSYPKPIAKGRGW